jgi:stalled ribosome rescue protein Dom34
MQTHNHAVIWVDHRQARIFHVGLTGTDEIVLRSHLPTQHIHHKANSIGAGHVSEDENFLKSIAQALEDAGQILILGPSVEKVVLNNYLRENDPKFSARIVAVESADHPSDREIIAYAKQCFKFDQPRSTPAR